eukprot:TRINITY_DN2749_c2_g1_i1.p1 TRINITY_DN2749_c2_g1~~TRINITY_DN2749_c2_g1_i1.p1  ORF type:complete len:1181 (+),score=428.79 TRINITY_DN2749_c2_g1_i1:213-3545(+)
MYVNGKFGASYTRLRHAVKMWPHSPDAYQLMGLMAQEKGDENTALELWLLQANFMINQPRYEAELQVLWQDLYKLALRIGRKREAIFCMTRLQRLVSSVGKIRRRRMKIAIHLMREEGKAAKEKLEAKMAELKELDRKARELEVHRITMLEDIGEWPLASAAYQTLFAKNHADAEVCNRLARLLVNMVMPHRALAVVATFLEHCRGLPDAEMTKAAEDENFISIANVAMELYLNSGRFTQALELTNLLMQLYGAGSLCDIHPDLAVKYCIALVYLSRHDEAVETFNKIRQGPPGFSVVDFGDLFYDFSQALLKCGHAEEAMKMLEEMARRGFAFPVVIFAIAKCNATLSREAAADNKEHRRGLAEKQFRAVLKLVPTHIDTRVELADLILEMHGDDAASQEAVLDLLDYNAAEEWTLEESLTVAMHRWCLLRRMQRGSDAAQLACQVLAGIDRPPNDKLSGDRRRADTRLKRLLIANQAASKGVIHAASTFAENAGAGGAMGAIQGVSMKTVDPKAQVLNAIEKQGAYDTGAPGTTTMAHCMKMGLRLGSMIGAKGERKLGRHPEGSQADAASTPDLADLQEDLNLAAFLAQSRVLRKAYALADGGSDEDSDAASQPRAKKARRAAAASPKAAGKKAAAAGDDDSAEEDAQSSAFSVSSLGGDSCDGGDAAQAVPVDAEFKGTHFTVTADTLNKNEALLKGDMEKDEELRKVMEWAEKSREHMLHRGFFLRREAAIQANKRYKAYRPECRLLNSFFTRHAAENDAVEEDAAGAEAEATDTIQLPASFVTAAQEGENADKATMWNCATLRTVLVYGADFGSFAVWRLVKVMMDDVTEREKALNEGDGLVEEEFRRHIYKVRAVLFSISRDVNRLFPPPLRQQARHYFVSCSFYVGELKAAYVDVRRMIAKPEYHTPAFWNMVNLLLLLMGSQADIRSMFRLLRLGPEVSDNYPMYVIMGNCLAYRHGSTKLSLGPYFKAMQMRPKEPMLPLLIAIQYAKYVMPRGNPNRHYTVLHGAAFLDRYKKMRLEQPFLQRTVLQSEVEYNIGRFFHQLNIGHAAHHYRECLALYDKGLVQPEQSMHREAAFNLHLILKQSGNARGAAEILRKYIRV